MKSQRIISVNLGSADWGICSVCTSDAKIGAAGRGSSVVDLGAGNPLRPLYAWALCTLAGCHRVVCPGSRDRTPVDGSRRTVHTADHRLSRKAFALSGGGRALPPKARLSDGGETVCRERSQGEVACLDGRSCPSVPVVSDGGRAQP